MFLTVFTSVMIMLIYMFIGFFLCKAKKADASHAKSLSAILIYVLSPAMIINSFINMDFSSGGVKQIVIFAVLSILLQLIFMVILYFVLRKKFDDARYRLLTTASAMGNVGFFGLPLVTGLFPGDALVACYSTIFVIMMNILVFTVGIFMITNDKKFISVKNAFINPSMIAIAASAVFIVFKIPIPDFANNMISLLAKMVTPVCMFVLGLRLSTLSAKKLFTQPLVYVTCALKLIVFPALAFIVVTLLPGLDETFRNCMIVLCACPSAAFILSMAELYDQGQELAANAVLLTTILSLVTIPIMLTVFSVV